MSYRQTEYESPGASRASSPMIMQVDDHSSLLGALKSVHDASQRGIGSGDVPTQYFFVKSTHDNSPRLSSTGMSTDHVFNVDAAQGRPASVAASPEKQDLARQIISANQDTDKGLLGQLTNNPFFTAVSPCALVEALEAVPRHTHTDRERERERRGRGRTAPLRLSGSRQTTNTYTGLWSRRSRCCCCYRAAGSSPWRRPHPSPYARRRRDQYQR